MFRHFYFVVFLLSITTCFSQGNPTENYTREWGTYFKRPVDMAIDGDNNLWVALQTDGSVTLDTLVTANAHQPTFGGGSGGLADVFLVKINPNGTLLYATYFGGESNDVVESIDIKDGKVYITGHTSSETGIATAGTYQESLLQNTHPNGTTTSSAGFIARFDAVTGQLDWGSYFQGDGMSSLFSVAGGEVDDVFVWGQTTSGNLGSPGTFKETIPPPYQDTNGDWQTPYYPVLARFDDTGQLLWSTYYGPDMDTTTDYTLYINGGVVVDWQNNVFVGGSSNDTEGYYGTTGAHQTTNAGGLDVFFAKFSSSGQRLFGTYYGGSEFDGIPNLHIGRDDSFYLAGRTLSSNNIATSGTYQDMLLGDVADFIVKFTLTGQRIWGTYINTAASSGSAVGTLGVPPAVDEDGYVFLGGAANTTSGISTIESWQDTFGGGTADMYVVKLDPTGTNLLWGSYYGGMGSEMAYKGCLQLTEDNELYLSGRTTSFENIASEEGLVNDPFTGVGHFTGFLAKLIPCPSPELPVAESPQEYSFGMTLEDLEVETLDWTGSTPIITWYEDSSGNTELPAGTQLEDGETYYVSQTIQGCDESGLVAVTVMACTQPGPPVGNETQGFEPGDTLGDLNVSGNNLTWYADEDSTIVLPVDTQLEDSETYYVSQTIDGCESGLLAITVVEGLSLVENDLSTLTLYPNPNDGSFIIEGLPAVNNTLTLYDLQGRAIYQITTQQENHHVGLENKLAAGVYLLQIDNRHQTGVFRVVVE